MANLAEIAAEWQDYAAEELAFQLRTGNHVHEVTGNLKGSFYTDNGVVLSDVEYASEELNRVGDKDGRPHAAIEPAWDTIEDDVIEHLAFLIQRDLELPTITIEVSS